MEKPPKIYREVILPLFEKTSDWKEFILCTEPTHIEETQRSFFGGGYELCNLPDTAFTRNRFIIWYIYCFLIE
jgi:hypothetical protein